MFILNLKLNLFKEDWIHIGFCRKCRTQITKRALDSVNWNAWKIIEMNAFSETQKPISYVSAIHISHCMNVEISEGHTLTDNERINSKEIICNKCKEVLGNVTGGTSVGFLQKSIDIESKLIMLKNDDQFD